MFGQTPLVVILLFMLYAVGTAVAAIACVYLLLRRGNAFAPDVVTPPRLRRWTAVFFAFMAVGHVWYMPTVVLTSEDDIMLCMLIGALLDCITVIPLAIVILFCMLQDRRRPLWPIAVAVAPLVVTLVVSIITRNDDLVGPLRVYLLLLGIVLTIYMVRAVREYGRWLRDNYADLEHKEVGQSFVVLAIILLMFGIYASGVGGLAYEYVVQVCGIVLICYLLWRVETLSDLSIAHTLPLPAEEDAVPSANLSPSDDPGSSDNLGSSDKLGPSDDLGPLLKQYCIDTQLYLQNDLTLAQLAQAIGSNRTYLGQYFSRQDTTYNAYINNLRIHHFISLYHEAGAARRPFTAQQLASESGYRSYSTFSLAFKQRMGQSVTAWMHDSAPDYNADAAS